MEEPQFYGQHTMSVVAYVFLTWNDYYALDSYCSCVFQWSKPRFAFLGVGPFWQTAGTVHASLY